MTIGIRVIAIFLILSHHVYGQSDWKVFSNTGRINGITTHDNLAYVSTRSGLLIIDHISGEEEFITTDDTKLAGSDLSLTVGMDNGHYWVTNSVGTIYYSDGENIDSLIDIRPSDMLHHQNKLWFISSGNLYSFDQEIETHYDLFPRGVEYMFVDNADQLWVQVEGCLALYDGKDIIDKILIDNFQDRESVEGYYIDKHLNHWLCIEDDDKIFTIKVYRDGVWTSYEIGENIYFEDFFEDGVNDILFTQRNMIGTIKSNQLTLDSTHLFLPEFEGGEARLHHVESDNTMWFSYTNYREATKILRVTPSGKTEYGLKNSFLTAFPSDIQKDCEDNIYCVSGSTVLKYDDDWSPVEVDLSNPSCDMRQLSINPNSCEVWAFSNTPDCSSMWNLSNETIQEVILSDSYCYSFKHDSNGILYAKCNNRLVRVSDLGVVNRVEEPGAPSHISQFTIGRSGALWAVGRDTDFNSMLFKYKNETWTSYEYEEQETLFLYEDSTEQLWVLDYLEILSFDPGTTAWTKHEALEDFFNVDIHHIHDIIEDSNNNFWFASYRGLVFWDRDKIVTYDIHNSDIHTNSMGDLNFAGGNLWMRHSEGLTRMKLDLEDTATQDLKGSNTNYSIYPNPSSGTVFLTNTLQHRTKIEIFNVQGGLISSQISDVQEYRLDLETGVYWIRLSGDSDQSVHKVIVI